MCVCLFLMFIELRTLHLLVVKVISMSFRASLLNIFKLSLKKMFVLELKVLMFAFTMFQCINLNSFICITINTCSTLWNISSYILNIFKFFCR